MKQPLNSSSVSGYITGKLKMADEKKDNLLNAINRLSNLSYEKGNREGDAEIRQRVKDLAAEIEQYYRTIRVFVSGKGGDTGAFLDILVFFNERYLENNTLAVKLDFLKKELEQQKKLEHEHTIKHARDGYARRANINAEDMERSLKDWEKIYLYNAEPLLRGFLADVNDIVVYKRINDKIERLITSDDVFARTGANYQEFKNSIVFFVELHIKLTRSAFTETEMKDVINRTLQLMGFRNSILNTRNINLEKYDEILSEIISEGNLTGCAKKYSGLSRDAVNAIKTLENKQRDSSADPKDLMKVLEDLCNLEDAMKGRKPDIVTSVTGLAKNDRERYLFHSPGTFKISLKFVSEYMRNSLILIVDWLNRELQKPPGSVMLLGSILECVPSMKEFIKIYQMAIEVSSQKSNQSEANIMSGEKHYISKNIAENLIQSIQNNCNAISNALVDSTYNVSSSSVDKSGVLAKKIEIIKESCFESFNKISRGLSEIDEI